MILCGLEYVDFVAAVFFVTTIFLEAVFFVTAIIHWLSTSYVPDTILELVIESEDYRMWATKDTPDTLHSSGFKSGCMLELPGQFCKGTAGLRLQTNWMRIPAGAASCKCYCAYGLDDNENQE